ncbi:hypothetical protein C5167_043455 [Papaver somniferum]|uniref:Replication protein A 70 kDa DNA-binding subunit B/D first OB fold domain-containing protein n=1 Tax=Papaver somniferum TaxID=3469 RepID=A0A4Y7L973_PAPSO|nr:hypothetical protein C5167_043455 [Papaver somniferum]
MQGCDENKPSVLKFRVARKWEEIDFTATNKVTNMDLLMIDENGDTMHDIFSKKLIWKFGSLLHEGGLYTLAKFNTTTEKYRFRPSKNDHRLFFKWDTEVGCLLGDTEGIPIHAFSSV